MAKIERDGTPKGQSIAIAVDEYGEAELISGSMKALALKNGDLVIIRLDSDRYRERALYRSVRDMVKGMLVATGRKAVALIVPADFDLELIPSSMAIELLEEIAAKDEG